MGLKQIGYEGENIVRQYYIEKGFSCINQNYTIKGGELDLIFENDDILLFIEVKVVDGIQDIMDYIGKKKLNYIKKTINSFIQENETQKEYRLDIVFVKNNKIFEIYENLELDYNL